MHSLKFLMRINATSCIAFGFLFAINPHPVATFLGAVPEEVIFGLAILLLVNGAHLVSASRRTSVRTVEVIWFSLGDFGWWLSTLLLIAANLWITSTAGIVVAIIVAIFVATLGVAQLWALGLQAHGRGITDHLRAIATSWKALPLWVKLWLFLLNAVFLAAAAVLPETTGAVALLAYVATGPLLAGQIGYDGGLRRILGLGHLVPWVPLLACLLLVAPGSAYGTLLSLTVAICLAFDVYDLGRFLKGDRAVIGQKSTRSTWEPRAKAVCPDGSFR